MGSASSCSRLRIRSVRRLITGLCFFTAVVVLKGCSKSGESSATTTKTPAPPPPPLQLSTNILERSFDPLLVSWTSEYRANHVIHILAKDALSDYVGRLETSEHPGGTAIVNLVNARSSGYELRLQDSHGTVIYIADVSFRLGDDEPTQGHITSEGNGSLRISWVSGSSARGRVLYKTGSTGWVRSLEMADPMTYTVDDLCDLPAKGSGWRDPGYFHSVLIPNSPDLTVKFGSDEVMSEEFKPSSALPPGDPTPHSVGLFGDLGFTGVTTLGGAEGFGKIFYGDFQSPAQTAITANKNIRLNVLIGDLAYANGFLTLWDQYGAEIEDTFGMQNPLMVSVGNHEWGSTNNSQTWQPNFTNNYMFNDAGGECGVPFKHRYPRFNDSGFAWWYSFDHGLVHYVMMSSEHEFTNGSAQHRWLRDDLSKVNRSVTPWLVFTSHRPVYQTCTNPGMESGILQHMESDIKPLLEEFGVDLFVTGHWHRYERTKPINGTYHALIGSPRYLAYPCDHTRPWWSEVVYDTVLGYTEMKVHNASILECIFWGHPPNASGQSVKVMDRYVLQK